MAVESAVTRTEGAPMLRWTRTFTARGDDGRDYILHVFADSIPVASSENPGAETEGITPSSPKNAHQRDQ